MADELGFTRTDTVAGPVQADLAHVVEERCVRGSAASTAPATLLASDLRIDEYLLRLDALAEPVTYFLGDLVLTSKCLYRVLQYRGSESLCLVVPAGRLVCSGQAGATCQCFRMIVSKHRRH